jgi:hypothetical protein
VQAFLKELMKEDQQRFLHLNNGLEFLASSAEMAQALRVRAVKLPAAVGADFRKIPVVSKSSWFPQFSTPLSGVTTQADENAALTQNVVSAFLDRYFPKDKADDLSYIISSYVKSLLEIEEIEKRPVFIIGTFYFLLRFSPACCIFGLMHSFC